jgi:anti-sigma factor RsiW
LIIAMDITDPILHAWFDGELPPAEAAAVEAQLRENPELAGQVRLWRADRDALRAQCDALLLAPVPARLTQAVWRAPLRWRVGSLAAGLALFVLGGAAGAGLLAGLSGSQPALQAASGEWLQRAAVAHAVYVPEKRHPVEVSVAQNQDGHLARWLTKRLDVPVKLFDLNPQGFDLVGGRLLPDERGPSAQLMYENADGQRVTVYLRKPDTGPADPAAAAFRYERQGELGLFYWVEGQGAAATGYALVGSLPREQLLGLAEAIYRQGGVGPRANSP